jgi:hypothetical protein
LKKAALVLVLLVFLWAVPVYAQTPATIAVPLETARFYWDPPANWAGIPDPEGQRSYRLVCGSKQVSIPGADVSFPVRGVVDAPGTYDCLLYALNKFGESPPAKAPLFEAGHVPSPAANIGIEVR